MSELEQYLREIADREACSDNEDFMVDDYAGGNMDDAYNMGMDDGDIFFARNILEQFFD